MNFRRRRPREVTDARRNDWSSWRSSGVIKRLFRQSGGVRRPDKNWDEQQLWEDYLRENYGDES